jgi:hypothetical protein
VPAVVIVGAEKCLEGVQMNWANFLVNQCLIECIEAQEKGTKFHYLAYDFDSTSRMT